MGDSGGDPGLRQGRALLVSDDPSDFVYAFQFARSIERRCAERGLCVDRIVVKPAGGADLAAELGTPLPAPIAAGTDLVVASDVDPSALRHLSGRRYDVVIADVRPPLFYDLLAAGLLAGPTLLWDRHLHGGLREEGGRRGIDRAALRALDARVWSLDKTTGPYRQPSLADAGLEHGSGHIWPIDLEFFRSKAPGQPDRLFAGGENQRDWTLFTEVIRDLPLEVHLVTGQPLPALPPNARVDRRLPLWRFRDAMAAAAVAAIPLEKNAAAGVSVIPMAMALGVAVVATRTPWTEPMIAHGEDGWLVPPGDVHAFRDSLVRLHGDAALRAHLVDNARRRVAALCDLEAFTRLMFATVHEATV
jgi:glycosyltransferase involved in cell wall biosynthesis